MTVASSPSPADVRRWLRDLREPHRLADPVMVGMLTSMDRLPGGSSPLAAGRAAAEVLTEAIERLRPAPGASRKAQLLSNVLRTCFVDGATLESAADRLGLSVRQLTRERARAIELVHAELLAGVRDTTPDPGYHFEPVPTIGGALPRPALAAALRDARTARGIVHVHGPAGVGKTTLVAELAEEVAERVPVLWYRTRPGVNDSLRAVLFELAQHLRAHGRPRLAEVTSATLPTVDVPILSRLAIEELTAIETLVVCDDYHLAEQDRSIGGFLEEAATRLPGLDVVTVGRHEQPRPRSATALRVTGLGPRESRQLLATLLPSATAELSATVHAWTQGIPQLTQMAASWLETASADEVAGGMAAFTERDDVQAFLLDCLTELLDSYDRDVLDAASIFRDRFSDEVLAYVAGRTTGEVADVSRRLVRYHIAARSRQSEVAFIHASVRDYVYTRLPHARKALLHQRAAQWYDRNERSDEARFHDDCAARSAATVA
ncbi:MAG: hypothetical protein QOE45_2267 [Frankiaceae bacterium]|nr:hypothetical protein [Frankiaceae bacterium]